MPFFMTTRKDRGARRDEPDDALRLRRLLDQHTPAYRPDVPAFLELGRHLGHGEHARRRRVRRVVAPRRNAREEAERIRRFHRRGRAPDQGEVHVASEARRSAADPTAGCWSARSRNSAPTCSLSRCRPSASWICSATTGSPADAPGPPSTDRLQPQQFPFLYKYSPVHNVKPGTAIRRRWSTTADHDDRVVPSHSFKFVGGDAGGAVVRQADSDSGRDAGLARLSSDRQTDRGARGSMVLHAGAAAVRGQVDVVTFCSSVRGTAVVSPEPRTVQG